MLSLPLFTFACATIFLPLNEALRQPSSLSEHMVRDLALYRLQGLVEDSAGSVTAEAEGWRVDCNKVQADLAPALVAAVASDGTLNPQRLDEVFTSNYFQTMAERGQEDWLKPTLSEFSAVTHFPDWQDEVVARSAIKRKTRHIFRSPAGFLPVISVSQTLESETGDVTAPVRETEVAIQRQDGKNWDFYAYNSSGARSVSSTFPSGERPSPKVCISCHYSPASHAVDRFFP